MIAGAWYSCKSGGFVSIWLIYVTNVERRFATPSVAHWIAAPARHQRPGRPLLMAETVARASCASLAHVGSMAASTTDDHLTVDDDAASVVCAKQ